MYTSYVITGIKKETFWSGAECTSVELSEVGTQREKEQNKSYMHFCSNNFTYSIGDALVLEDLNRCIMSIIPCINATAQSTIYNIDRSEWSSSRPFISKELQTESCVAYLKRISNHFRSVLNRVNSLDKGKGNRLRFILTKNEEEVWVLTVIGIGVEINAKAYFIESYFDTPSIKIETLKDLLSPFALRGADIQKLVVYAGHLAELGKRNSLIWEYVYYTYRGVCKPDYGAFNFILRS